MSYSEVFGGGSINPAQRTYLPLVTAIDVVLQWPIEQQIGGDNVAADIIDINATAPGLNIDFSDARQVSDGFTSLMTNIGAQTVTIRDSAGGTIISLAPGEAWFIYLTDNSAIAGVWRTFQLGATVSVANASALAGAGLKAIATTLNRTIPPTLTAVTPVNWADADRAQFTVWTGGVGVLNLPGAGAVGADWFSMVRNGGSGDLTITPAAGTIDDAATLVMAPGTSAIVVTDGANFFTIGLGTSTVGTFDFVQIDVSGVGNFVLSGVQLNRISYRFTGLLTGNRNIVVPNTVQQYWVDNRTNGAFQLLVNTAAQITPVEVLQNNRSIFYCDGVDVLDADTGTLTPPISIGQGGTGAVTAPLALSNLGAVPITRNINTAANSGLGGGGDLSADRSFVVDVDNTLTELVVNAVADTMQFYDDSAVGTRKSPIDAIVNSALSTAFKSVNTSRLNDVVESIDPDIQLIVPVTGTYLIMCVVSWDQSTDAGQGISWSMRVNGGAAPGRYTSMVRLGDFIGALSSVDGGEENIGSGYSYAPTTTTGAKIIFMVGTVSLTVADVLSFFWAQENSSGFATTVSSSSLFALRVS